MRGGYYRSTGETEVNREGHTSACRSGPQLQHPHSSPSTNPFGEPNLADVMPEVKAVKDAELDLDGTSPDNGTIEPSSPDAKNRPSACQKFLRTNKLTLATIAGQWGRGDCNVFILLFSFRR